MALLHRSTCAALLVTLLPGFTGGGSVPLVVPLQRSVPGYTNYFGFKPALELDRHRGADSLRDALGALDRAAPSPTLDDVVIVVSALKLANENKALQSSLETQLGLATDDVRAWMARNVPRVLAPRGVPRHLDAFEKSKRAALGLGPAGQRAGSGPLALPLAFSGGGLVPAFMVAGTSAEMMAAGAALFTGPENTAVIERTTPEMMVAMCGTEQSTPGARVDWQRASLAPTEELIKRLRHAALAQKSFAAVGATATTELGAGQIAVLTVARDLFARDVVQIQILLAVLSRQMDAGRHLNFVANLVATLPAEHMGPLLLATRALGDAPGAFLGIAAAVSNDLAADRRREVTHFARWTEAALLARAAAGGNLDGPDLVRNVEEILEEDAESAWYRDLRARPKMARARAIGAVDAPGQRESLRRLIILRGKN